MKQTIAIFIMLFLSALLRGQEYLVSENYIYGCASDKNEAIASENALFSFANAVGVKIVKEVKYTTTEKNGVVSENFVEQKGISSCAINVKEIKKDITVNDGIYTVYYYLNKQEYIENRIAEYKENLSIGRSYKETRSDPHADNLAIGYMYVAYEAVNDEILNALYRPSISYKADVYEEIKCYYKRLGLLDGHTGRHPLSKRPGHTCSTLTIRDINMYPLPGIEYFSAEGVWRRPIRYGEKEIGMGGNEGSLSAIVEKTNDKYRLTYEILVDGEYCKLAVPEEFYFYTFTYMG